MEKKQITFALHCGVASDQTLTAEHLSPVEKELTKIDKAIKDLIIETRFSKKRQESHFHGKNSFQFNQ